MAEEIPYRVHPICSSFASIATMAAAPRPPKAEGLEPKHLVSAPASRPSPASSTDRCMWHSRRRRTASPRWSRARSRRRDFAQINEKDGFFLTGRDPDPAFTWDKLKGRKAIVDHGTQPMAMFKYACFKSGLDFKDIDAVDAGSTDKMIAAFRAGQADFIHLQGPAPQQLEHDKVGHVVASVGDAIGPCAFSSLAATREWLASDVAKTFMRGYRKARAWLIATPAAEVARAEAPFFPGIDPAVLAATIAAYQKLGNWSPHVEITRPAFEATLDIFQHAGLITKRHTYEDVVAPPPA